MCQKCGGICCKENGCIYLPGDFKTMDINYIISLLNEGNTCAPKCEKPGQEDLAASNTCGCADLKLVAFGSASIFSAAALTILISRNGVVGRRCIKNSGSFDGNRAG